MSHGIKINEIATSVQIPVQLDTVIFAVGTARYCDGAPKISYTFNEYDENFGYKGDFKKYTLDEVAKTAFSLYGVSPVVCVNVLNPAKHFTEIEKAFEGVTAFNLSDEAITDTLEITSGEYIPATKLVKDEDFEVLEAENEGTVTKTFKLKKLDNVDGAVKIKYNSGGVEVETEVTLAVSQVFELPSDTNLAELTAESGEVDTLVDLDFEITQSGDVLTVEILDEENIVDDKILVKYHELDPTKVTAADIIGGVDAATGLTSGLEIAESVPARWNLGVGVIIAPGYSTNNEVAAAMVAKAKILNAMAVNDLDAETYTAAIEGKTLADSHLITCWGKVALNGEKYNLSTHLAALMFQVDSGNSNVPSISPSNKVLQIDSVVNSSGEIFMTQEQCNLLNQNGIVTIFAGYSGFRAWGNYTSIGATADFKDRWISTRRMINFIRNYLLQTYFSNLDAPINRRQIDSILQSCNLYLASLVSSQALIGGRIEFLSSENNTTDLMSGKLTFHLYLLPCPPAEEIDFNIEIDTDYFEGLFE